MPNEMVQSALLAQNINEYYLSAFDHALVVVGMVFGVVGVIVPTGIAYFQARQAKHEAEQLKKQIAIEVERQVREAKENILKENAAALTAFQERSDILVSELKKETKTQFRMANSGAMHVQALMYKRAGNHVSAFNSAIGAGEGYVDGSDFHHLRRVVEEIAIKSLANFDGTDAKKQSEKIVRFGKLLDRMSKCDHKGAFNDLIEKGKKKIKEAKEKEPQVEQAKMLKEDSEH